MQWWCSAQGVDWTWTWRAYPGVWLFVLGMVAASRWLTGPGGWRDASSGERASFVSGILLLWAFLDWPMGPIAAGYSVSAHALQFLVETMLAAPLILYAVRRPFGRRMEGRAVPVAARFAFHPLVAAVVFNVVVAVTHFPSVVDALMPSGGGAFVIDSAWFFTGIVFWWPVIMPVPAYERFGAPMKILYLLIGTLFHTVIGMILLSAELPLYGIYELAPPILAVPPRADQQLGGGIMEIGVFFAIVVGSAILFFRWAGEDTRHAP